MKYKILPKRLLSTSIISVLLAFFIASISLLFVVSGDGRYVNSVLAAPAQKLEDKVEKLIPGIPFRIRMPKIGVNAAVESVGLNAKGEVGIPKGLYSTAWFDLGPRPGDEGNAIIVGHYGIWKNGKQTVFNNLSKLRKGDKLYIEDAKGKTIVFVVRELKSYSLSQDATEVFVANDGKAHLNLVTCDGIWNKVKKSYPKRLVVFTDKL